MSAAPFWITLKVTALATLLLFVVGLATAWALARRSFRGRVLVEALILLPLVLPPTVMGYYLLLALGRGGPLAWAGIDLLFTWPAAALAAAVMGLPLMVEASRSAIAEVDPRLEQAARSLGAGEWEVAWRVTLPLARNGILAGLVLGGARALGEFGATLMVAGSIPGRTQTVPLAIYDAIQAGRQDVANRLVLVMTVLALASVVAVRWLQRPTRGTAPRSPGASEFAGPRRS